MARDFIFNGLMQSDLDANFHRIINLVGSDNNQSGTIYVDPNAEDGTGVAETTSPFSNLEDALEAAQAGFNIIMRAGLYQFDGQLTVDKRVNIIGYGAIISPLTAGVACGLEITAGNVRIYGVEFDGGIAVEDAVNDDVGAITILGSSAFLKDIDIHDQHGVGVELRDRYDFFVIDNSRMVNCYRGLTGAIGTSSISGNSISNCLFKNNRYEGVKITGIDNAGGIVLRDIRIQNSEFQTNDVSHANKAGINIDAGAADFLISGNWIVGHYDSIIAKIALRGEISDNVLSSANNNHISVIGHKRVSITGNVIDGANQSTDIATTLRGIQVAGDYAASNDSGPMVISGNQITNISNSGSSINLDGTNHTTITGNALQHIAAASYLDLLIGSNNFNITTTHVPIFLDASTRGSHGCSILANRFYVESTAPARLISTSDVSATGNSNIHISGNSSSPGKTYSGGIFGNAAGDLATDVYKSANTPQSTGDNTTGWVNDDEIIPLKQVFVSKAHGNNARATRESRAHPYLTITAAIAAATSGDTVYIVDGVFNEVVTAKDGITVRFEPEASLVCTSAAGCVVSGADGDTFYFYHEHAQISSSVAGGQAVLISHTGSYRLHVGGILNTGANTGTICHAVNVTGNANVQIHLVETQSGNGIVSENGAAISAGTGADIAVRANFNEIGANTLNAISNSSTGHVHIDDARIYSGGAEAIVTSTATAFNTYKNCTILSFGSGFAAVKLNGADTNAPIFRDCVLIAEATATKSINCTTGTHTVVLMGTMMANKGANPPTSVTFTGGGTYVVDAGVTDDWY